MSAFPRSSPWGAVQHCEVMANGVFMVNTSSHTGIMVRKNAADCLSNDALKYGFSAKNYICFDGHNTQIVIRELLDKKLWQIPDRVINKAQYEDGVNKTLQDYYPEYWAAREQSPAVRQPEEKEENTMTDARKEIIFRDGDYKEKFRIKDGESIKITVAYDGEEIIRKCRYLDEAHMNVGASSCYHMDEFMEKQTRVGNQYEPIPSETPKPDIETAEHSQPPRDAEIPMSEAAMRDILGGEPEIISRDKFSATVTGIRGNGTTIVCGMNGDNLTSLHPYDAQRQKRELAERVPATEEKKPSTLAERLEAGKAKAAAHNAARQTNDTPQKKKDVTEH
jgi:hypothetical protein